MTGKACSVAVAAQEEPRVADERAGPEREGEAHGPVARARQIEKLVRILAITVPAFFWREKPISRKAKPACMNMTRTPATMTQSVFDADGGGMAARDMPSSVGAGRRRVVVACVEILGRRFVHVDKRRRSRADSRLRAMSITRTRHPERPRRPVERQRRRHGDAPTSRSRDPRSSAPTSSSPPSSAERLPKDIFKRLAADAQPGRAARHLAGRPGRRRDEGLGHGEGRDALHPLVPAADRHDRREARLVLRPRPARAPRWPSSPARSSSRASPTRRRSRPAASARPSRPAATPRGTPPPPPSSSRTPTVRSCASRPRSSRGPARRSTTRSRCCARWTR